MLSATTASVNIGVSEDLSPYHAELAVASGKPLPVCPSELSRWRGGRNSAFER